MFITPEQDAKAKINNDNLTPVEARKQKIIINELALEKQGFVSLRGINQRNGVNAEFRAIKHEIMSHAFSSENEAQPTKKSVMLTSAFPNAGKTFCSINLALMLSLEKDKSVLLIDADVLHPNINKIFKYSNKLVGLIDYLNEDVLNIEDVVYETSIPNLKILPAGNTNSLSYELLASEKMTKLNESLSAMYSDSIIVFDGPPILGVIETVSLSSLVRQVLIVVEHNKTKLSEIKEVTSKLHNNLFTGLIINKSVDLNLSQYGYDKY